MTITDRIIPINKYNRPGTKFTPQKICVHYTGNAGSSAAAGAAYQMNVAKGVFASKGQGVWTSSQYLVGLNGEVIRCVPDDEMAYAAANNNRGVIHIEVCHQDTSGKFNAVTITALGELVRSLMKKYSISADKVVRHYDLTGKHCPMYYVDETRWAALHDSITAAAAPANKLYRVQVGAFSSKSNAEAYLKKVKESGFNAFLVEVETDG